MGIPHRNTVARAAIVALLGITSAGCGGGVSDPHDTPDPASSSPVTSGPADPTASATSGSPAVRGTTITTAPSDFGTVLWGPDRRVVYIWEREPTQEPTCYDDCAEAWPPVLTTGEPVAGGDVDPSLLGTTERRDGTTQVTYNDHPLYYYAHEGPGEVKCHDVATHGGLWWVVTPAGDRAD